MAKVPPKPCYGPYCSNIELAAYLAMDREERAAMREEIDRVRDENFPELRVHPAQNSPGFGLIRFDEPQRVLVGISVSFNSARLRPGEPSPEEVYPDSIGCVPLEIRMSGPICTAVKLVFDAQVVDDETGTTIKGAYWRSETLDGEVFLELKGGGDHERYRLMEDGSVIAERATESGSEDFRVVVAKEGYVTIVRKFTVRANTCHIQGVGGARKFRLVKGAPGEDDVFRELRLPEGATRPMARIAAPLSYHAATLLQDGKVLVIGGRTYDGAHNIFEIYDPATNAWTPSSGSLIARRSQGAVKLDDGRVLVAGDVDSRSNRPTSAHLLDPSKESWGPVEGPNADYYINTLILLNDGKILVIGGETPSTEVYDPKSERWTSAGKMANVRLVHTATLLYDGRVLAVGGIDDASEFDFVNDSAELFDPVTGLWSQTGSMKEARHGHTAILLEDGRVLVSGGQAFSRTYLATSEIYDPATGVWTSAASLNHSRSGHTATLLLDGRVLVAGGKTRWAEIYDPSTDTWSPAAQMKKRRQHHTATRLVDGRVLIVGGADDAGMYASAEIYDPVRDSWD